MQAEGHSRSLHSAIAVCAAIMAISSTSAFATDDPFCPMHMVGTAASPSPLQVKFAGVSTLVFSDHETTWMTDGFFTRPDPFKTMFRHIQPDERIIRCNLKRLGITKLAAVVPVHSHYDHAIDAAFVARETQAELIGSDSTLNIGYGLQPQPKLHRVEAGDLVSLGKWTLKFYESNHGPSMWTMAAKGNIDAPLEPAKNARRWKEGAVWSIMVEHENGPRMLVHASAGRPGRALKEELAKARENEKVDILFLGIGLLGRAGVRQKHRRALWDEVVVASGAKRVILIHWDNLTRTLNEPLACPPWPFDNAKKTLSDFREWAAKQQVELVMPPVFTPFDPSASGINGAGCGAGV